MMRTVKLLIAIGLICALAGCAANNIKAPCPNFGKYCHKTPINSWDYRKQ